MKIFFAAWTTAVFLASSPVAAHDDAHHSADDAYGKPGDPAKVSRTIVIDMTDKMRFTPASITVKKGDTVRFTVKNSGQLKHEMVIGSAKQLREHAALMKKFPEMEHEDPNQVSLDSGTSGDMVWQFTKAGTFDFACLQPGHFEAGMRGKIVVK